MRKLTAILLILSLFLAGCATLPEKPASPPDGNTTSTDDTSHSDSLPPVPHTIENEEGQEEITICLTDPEHPLSKQIAADYPAITSYQQVMGWFCSGVEFEDILTALQTEEISNYPADLLLTMREYGQN